MTDTKSLIAGLEQTRRDAFVSGDVAVLDKLLSENLIFSHTNGMVEGKASFIASLGTKVRFLRIESVEEDIAAFDDVAVVVGELRVDVQPTGMDLMQLRTRISAAWAKEAGDWRLIRYQATRITL